MNGVSGYHIDPYQNDKASALLVEFFEKCQEDPSHWSKISQGGLQRIEEKYICNTLSLCSSYHLMHMRCLFYQHWTEI